MKNKFKKGFTLAELLITISIITIGLLGIAFIAQRGVRYIYTAYNQLTAAYLAQEGVEIIKNIRDGNYLELLRGGSSAWDEGIGDDCASDVCCYEVEIGMLGVEDPLLTKRNEGVCNFSNLRFLRYDSSVYNYSSGSRTLFKRGIEIKKVSGNPDTKEITVKVFWEEKGKVKAFYPLKEKIFNWWGY